MAQTTTAARARETIRPCHKPMDISGSQSQFGPYLNQNAFVGIFQRKMFCIRVFLPYVGFVAGSEERLQLEFVEFYSDEVR